MEYVEVDSRVLSIGTSINKSKKLVIKSRLHMSPIFVSFPFGSTRTRYQYPDPFTYVLKRLNYEDGFYFYRLDISRKDNVIRNSPNKKFFYGEGWSLPLVALNIVGPETITDRTAMIDIENYFPKDYGKTSTCSIIFPSKFEVGIVVPIFSRAEYLKRFFESLAESNLDGCILVLVDESMTKEVDQDKIEVRSLVEEFALSHTCLVKVYKKKHGNMFDSIRAGFDFLSPFCNYLTTIDSDTVHKKDWVSRSLETYIKVKKEHEARYLLLSGFNTVNKGRHKIVSEKEDYFIKDSVGGCHLFFESSMYYHLLRYAFNSYKWDSNIESIMRKESGMVVATKPSVINHIGEVSSGHRHKVKGTSWDVAADF